MTYLFNSFRTLTTAILLIIAMSSNAYAMPKGDASKGELKTPSCRFCHGSNGIASQPNYPNLAGQQQQYLYDAMLAYTNDMRLGPMAGMMKGQLQNLNAQDLADIAAYYSAMK
ncbi:c-type cytochrome [Photobacterium carnosum]|uniref:c-type cytochrome n=1 Tax=Photobacterium carnosum TaxID=2023717 RepID=UPI001E2CA795|nr:cytochrome c [Photobacterium carnosum]MCD9516774.1 c-type cytochrome [Photobacterium carnosum]MCD9521611.1 c-type cytochrome [Photobacterium carnosum]MCD9558250.1 cytochrome c [Photobacterium carnosum]